MIEIRPIKKKESERFLALLCRVFDLDASRARHVFFNEPLFDLDRKWALFVDGQMRSILTTTPLEFGFGRAFGVAGVATDPEHQRQGYGQRLIEHVLQHGAETGEPGCLLFAHKEDVYNRCGFETIDMVVRGAIVTGPFGEPPDTLPFNKVQQAYDAWASAEQSRLRRNDRRWKYWRWIPRTCEPAPGGYVCVEPHLCREAIVSPGMDEWPVMPGTSWLGLESMTEALGVPLTSRERELFVMASRIPGKIQMFMTDQF